MGYDVYSAECPARAVLDHVSDKWALLVLHRLGEGPVRFNALRREIHGLSQKVLSQVLKRLERDGLIGREVFATVPVTVEYSLTHMGECLNANVGPLLKWAEANADQIRAAQAAYDVRLAEAA